MVIQTSLDAQLMTLTSQLTLVAHSATLDGHSALGGSSCLCREVLAGNKKANEKGLVQDILGKNYTS